MSGHSPSAIITDQCKVMQRATETFFSNTKHCWCLWHIMKKLPEKLKGYSQYVVIEISLQNAVHGSLRNLNVVGEKCFASTNFTIMTGWEGCMRSEWVPIFVKNTFWAGISTKQRSESMHTLLITT